ncbi:MAG: Protein TolB [Chlamydiae bacterium]|nr:Protein TolB [Chlamydiota bacterium]
MKYFVLLLLILIPFISWADSPLEVRLATEVQLVPIYMSQIKGDGKELQIPYLKKIDQVLRFDLNQNGSTVTLPVTQEREKGKSDLDVYFVIESRITGKNLKITIYDISLLKEYTIDGVELVGTLSRDRQLIHELADTLHEELFGVRGIASTRIIFTDKDKTTGEVYVVDYDGANQLQLTNQNALCVTPSFIPPRLGLRGKDYFYVCYKTGQPKIFHATLDGGNGQRVTQLRGNQLMPQLSPQRNKLVFVSDAAGNPDIFLYKFNPQTGIVGKPRQIYAVPFATQASPVFNPSGTKIALVSNKDGRAKIYIMDIPKEGETLKDIHPQLLIKQNRSCTAPSWSPDGTKIAYTSKVDGTRQVWVCDLVTGIDKQVTRGAGHKENATWAPNSLHLAYNDAHNVYMINLHQLKPVQLTRGTSEKKFPSWEQR